MMTDPNKTVKNPLFSTAVTGGTIEDFSQNALLLPAKEKPSAPPAVLNVAMEQPSIVDDSSTFLEPIPADIDYFQNQEQAQFFEPQPVHLPQPQSSNLSSVFSSFSNILKLKPQTPEPAPVEFLPQPSYSEPALDAPPVPLFPVSGTTLPPSQTPQVSEPVNTYRRSGLKRPVYAQLPGLVNSPADVGLAIQPQTSSTSYFQPHTLPAKPVPQQSSNLQSPVMSAIPVSELPTNEAGSTDSNGENSSAANTATQVYRPVYHHWFHKKEVEGKVLWQPFSMVDSLALDGAFTSNDLDPDKVVAAEGGRYDVNILRRERVPVYWKGNATEVRRCSWFHKGSSDGRYVPYEENIATKLEDEFKTAFESNHWHKKVELPNGETVVFHSADVLVLFPPTESPDAWGNTPNQSRARMVKRGMDEFDIDEGEPAQVDHLLFMIHGIGSVCDLKFRTVEEVVEEFRSISLQLVQAHYKSSCEKGLANRVEVLPISWHDKLHSEETGIDRKLKSITLASIPRLREFTNDTLLDILFYTSPIYCQTIISTVGNQMNKTYELFKQRNPNFQGGVSVSGHSLGSLILFDLLCHQQPETEPEQSENNETSEEGEPVGPLDDVNKHLKRRMSRISYMMGTVGTGQPQIHYPSLKFHPQAFFALGSPIGMFVTVRGLDTLGEQFAFPTCKAFFNIFHPHDPVAYRVESLVNPELSKLKPVLIPHHKGRKRMHLELKETMARVGADLKQRVIDSMKSTWNSVYQLAMFHKQDQASLEAEVDKALQEQILKQDEAESEEPEEQQTDLPLGLLNNNRRMDYVLQEAPFESFNEYIFALTSHVCYWESEDTMLLILKEIYTSMNVYADDKIPQQTMTIERPPSSPKFDRANNDEASLLGTDPTIPKQANINLGPPPMSGFVKKT